MTDLVMAFGTHTEVGKTWVGAQVLARLRSSGVSVAARKPAQSHDPDDPHPTDAEVLAAATGDAPSTVCLPRRTYPVAYAPPMAADALDLVPPSMSDLLSELEWPDPPPDVAWVETVGGPRSPIAIDGDGVDLADALEPDLIVMVADAGLGTVNAIGVSTAPLVERFRVVTFLNRFDPDVDLHRRNRDWLQARQGPDVVVDIGALTSLIRPTDRRA